MGDGFTAIPFETRNADIVDLASPSTGNWQVAGERPAILQIIPSLESGGAERSTIDIAAGLAREGFVALVASAGGRMVPELQAVGGEWIEMPVASRSPPTLAANALRLRQLIRSRNIRLVHARSRAPAWSALWAVRGTQIPFVTTYHGLYSARTLLKRLYNSVMVRGDAVIANSEWTAQHIRAEYGFQPRNLTVIPRGVDLTRFDPAGVAPDRVALLRNLWGAQADDIVVLLPGRLTRLKGHLVLIEALSRLARGNRLEGVRALIAGDAQRRDSYEKELRQAVTSAGLGNSIAFVRHVDDMPVAYLASDIVVSASTQAEAFGRVAAEASAMGRPVIATDHGGARETVLPGVSGLLVRPGDAGALCVAIEDLIDRGGAARELMGACGRAHVTQNFALDRMCADTLLLYRKLLIAA